MSRARALAVAAALGAAFGPARSGSAETAGAPAVVATAPQPPAVVVTAPQPPAPLDAYPLVFLFQGDAVVDSKPGAGESAGNDPVAGSHVRVRRLRAGEDVRRGAFRARVVLEGSSGDEPFAPVEGGRLGSARDVRLTEAFAAWRPHRAVELDVGAQRAPFSLSRQVDEADLRLPERAQTVVALAPDYRTGVAFASDLGALNLRLAGMSADRWLDEHLLSSGFFGAARLGADPLGPMGTTPWRRPDDAWSAWWRFSAGVSVLYGTLLAPRTLGFGADAQLQWRRLTIAGEYLAQHLGASAAALPFQGAVLEPGVFAVADRLELVLRGAWYHQPSPADGGSADTLAAGGALTFFLRDAHLRFQAGVELRRTLDARLPDSGWAILRLSLVL
jgi:hypothetical protein